MLFNSYEFIFVFLPVTYLLYFLLGKYSKYSLSPLVLLAASLIFAACSGTAGLLTLIGSTVLTYLLSRLMVHFEKRKKPILVLGLIFHVGLLCFFKYTAPLSRLLQFSPELCILLPLGVSFYTFQQIAWLVDLYHGKAAPMGFLDYCLFVSFFPKLVQGPITLAGEWTPQLETISRPRLNAGNLASGIYLFAIGLAKKVLIADIFEKIVTYGYGHIPSLTRFEALLTILAYTFQLYYDFSGYCDMACGVGTMLNIHLPQNFNSPYKARNISDFWKRWHMTLTNFLTRYIYIPLGGSRKGLTRTCVNILIVFLISGIWHGTGLTFLVWGVLHGLASVLYRLGKRPYDRLPGWLQWLLTFLFINITWVFFRAGSLQDAASLLKALIFGGGSFAINAELTEALLQPTFVSIASRFLGLPLVAILGCVLVMLSLLLLKNSNQKARLFRPSIRNGIVTWLLLLLSILSLSGVSTFLYSNF